MPEKQRNLRLGVLTGVLRIAKEFLRTLENEQRDEVEILYIYADKVLRYLKSGLNYAGATPGVPRARASI